MSWYSNALQSIKGFLKEAFDPHHELYPAPEVKEKLEEKGYRFQFNAIAMPRAVIVQYDITSPGGKPVARRGAAKGDTQQYLSDYRQAVQELKAEGPK